MAARYNPKDTLKVMQLNVNRSRAAHDLLYASAIQAQVDLLLVSEPNRRKVLDEKWKVNEESSCAIAILSSIPVTRSGTGQGYVWVDLKDVRVFSCYFSPNNPLNELEEGLAGITRDIGQHRRVIVGGDFNAKSPEWGGLFEDRRGSILADWAAMVNLQCLNKGSSPTFERGVYGSILDVTFATECIARHLRYWKVQESETLSDHRCIEMCFMNSRKEPPAPASGWVVDEPGKIRLKEAIDRNFAEEDTMTPNKLTNELKKICKNSLKKKGKAGKKPVYWWTAEVAEKRRICLHARRALKREARLNGGIAEDYLVNSLRSARSDLSKEIRKSKQACWRKLCESVDSDP